MSRTRGVPRPISESAQPVRESKGETMKYMMMMQGCTKENWETFCGWQKQDLQAHIAFMRNFSQSLRETGELLAGEGLDIPGQAVAVRAGKDGTPVTDGVFPESKEFLMGYWIVEVKSPERAYE